MGLDLSPEGLQAAVDAERARRSAAAAAAERRSRRTPGGVHTSANVDAESELLSRVYRAYKRGETADDIKGDPLSVAEKQALHARYDREEKQEIRFVLRQFLML